MGAARDHRSVWKQYLYNISRNCKRNLRGAGVSRARTRQPANGDDIIMLARKVGLKDTKVARISETHAGLRFIVGGGA